MTGNYPAKLLLLWYVSCTWRLLSKLILWLHSDTWKRSLSLKTLKNLRSTCISSNLPVLSSESTVVSHLREVMYVILFVFIFSLTGLQCWTKHSSWSFSWHFDSKPPLCHWRRNISYSADDGEYVMMCSEPREALRPTAD